MAMIALAGCTSRAEPWHLTNVAGHLPDLDFTLTGDDGRPVSGDSFKGRASLVYFGYTHCPDVCPETMGRLMQVLEKLGPDAQKVRILFITVDPARDTPEVLKAYMGAFDPAFLALIPTPDQLAATAKDFKVYYKKVEGKTPTSYAMDHSAASYIYDPQGRLRLYARYGAGVPAMVSDLKTLLAS